MLRASPLPLVTQLASNQHRVHSYTISKKIEVVEWHRASGGNVSRTSRPFKIDRKRIREWNSKYETLKQLNYGKQKMKRKFTNGVPVFSELAAFSVSTAL